MLITRVAIDLPTAMEVAKKGGHLAPGLLQYKALKSAKASATKNYPDTKVLTIVTDVSVE